MITTKNERHTEQCLEAQASHPRSFCICTPLDREHEDWEALRHALSDIYLCKVCGRSEHALTHDARRRDTDAYHAYTPRYFNKTRLLRAETVLAEWHEHLLTLINAEEDGDGKGCARCDEAGT